MGGYGSGRKFGRPTVEESLCVDLAKMIKAGQIAPSKITSGCLTWSSRGQPIMQAQFIADMTAVGDERLELSYGGGTVLQSIRLQHTVPNYGGKRWWMVCPYRGSLVKNLYLPPGGNRFASRQFYRLGYRSERSTEQTKTLERLFALQAMLGSPQGLGVPLHRPKGMWCKTFARHQTKYAQLQADVVTEFTAL